MEQYSKPFLFLRYSINQNQQHHIGVAMYTPHLCRNNGILVVSIVSGKSETNRLNLAACTPLADHRIGPYRHF
jgi:hypothetical protein